MLCASRWIVASLTRTLAGFWIGLWFIAGTIVCASGFVILAMQVYAWFSSGLWSSIRLQEICRIFNVSIPVSPIPQIAETVQLVLLLPAYSMFILIGLQIALMALMAKRNLERRSSRPPPIQTVDFNHPLNQLGIKTLHIHGRR
jgi:hypothetical protein